MSETTETSGPSALGHADITVRRIRFEYPDGLDAMLIEGQPEESFIDVSLSLLLPYLEPYLVRSMRRARPLLTDARLVAELDLFNAQEGQHYRQHIALNDALRIPARERVRELEATLEADYQRYTRSGSLRWNLAYAEGFEAYTFAMARFSFETGLFDRLHPAVRDLYTWHLVEEIEHRTVAFDVYEHAFGGYVYRLFVGLFAQWHLNRFLVRAATAMADDDPAAFRATYGGRLRAPPRRSLALADAPPFPSEAPRDVPPLVLPASRPRGRTGDGTRRPLRRARACARASLSREVIDPSSSGARPDRTPSAGPSPPCTTSSCPGTRGRASLCRLRSPR